MVYSKQTWIDDDDSSTLSADRLNHIEQGIYDVSTTLISGAPDAAPTVKGVVQLAGDLGGSANSPTVPLMVKTTGDQNIAGIKTFASSPVVPDPTIGNQAANKTYVDAQTSSGSVPDATSGVKGKIQLAGDLAGTAAAPTVPGAVKTTTDQSISGIKTFANSPIVPDPTTAQQAASKAYVDSNGGSVADATTTSKGKIQLAGDLAGTAAAPTVPNAVKTSGNQSIDGVKTFTSAPVVPDSSFATAKIVGLDTSIAAINANKANKANESHTGTTNFQNINVTGTTSFADESIAQAEVTGLVTGLLAKGNTYTLIGNVTRTFGGLTLAAAPAVCVIWVTIGATTRPTAFDTNGDIWFNEEVS